MGRATDDADPTLPPELGAGSGAAFAATIAGGPTAPPAPIPAASAVVTRPLASALDAAATIDAPVAGEPSLLPYVPMTHYRPDREIARGGMGRIVAAEDLRLGRAVALKELIEPAGEHLGRFQREALITARLQHPGIVPVYEAGRWPSGDPFFAMKLVSGRPLDRVIAEAITLADRLALLPRLAAAADAIAYAHSQRVIHRDLKPANVLIGEFGETVVIDWGLAKSLDDADAPDSLRPAARPDRTAAPARSADADRPGDHTASTLTIAGSVMGTPAYMAPEQARGAAVDQRADVFALGAMLYHLLAGVPPYHARTATEVIAAAAAGKVRPLAGREPGAPTDLVAIVERAMAPYPGERYADAGELATELRRFLTGQLVSAHRYTAGERVGRFVRRHRAAVMIAVLAAIGFAAGTTFAVRRIIAERDVADQARQLADARRRAAERLIDTMLSDVKDRLQQIGRVDLLASLGTEIRDYYATLGSIPGGMPTDDIDRMAAAIDLLGVAERESGKLDKALATWTEARATLARILSSPQQGGRTVESARFERRLIARLDFELGTIHQQRGATEEAVRLYTRAEQELDALLGELPGDRVALLASAEVRDRMGDLLRNQGKVDQALDAYSQAKAERERASGPGSRPQEEVLALSTSHLKLGLVFQIRGESARAIDELRAAHRLRQGLVEAQRDDVALQNKLLEVELPLGDLQRQIGDPTAAIETYRSALPVITALTRRDPDNTTWQRLRGNLEADFGFALMDTGEYRAGLAELETAIEVQRALTGRDPRSAIWLGDLSRTYTRAGDAELALGELDRGIARFQAGLDLRKDLVAKNPASASYRRALAWSYAKLAHAYTVRGEPARAIEAHEQALALRSALVAEAPDQREYRSELSLAEAALGALVATGDPRRSRQLLDAAIARARALVTADPADNDYKEALCTSLIAEADAARALGDPPRRAAALDEALSQARIAVAHAPHNVRWSGLVAEVHGGLAELAAARRDAPGAAAAWQAVRDALEPLARAGRLAADRQPLLQRARAAR
ncbi:MAG TPA: protein kinase [Kofleriaceae bacterium]|jgi:tetratricopeptide (TPR) repeat protein|nr:protein kinase [Kofleriaceae bacterium]